MPSRSTARVRSALVRRQIHQSTHTPRAGRVFKVRGLPSSTLPVTGQALIQFGGTIIHLLSHRTHRSIIIWPLISVERFRVEHNVLSFSVNSDCATGAGDFFFDVGSHARDAFQALYDRARFLEAMIRAAADPQSNSAPAAYAQFPQAGPSKPLYETIFPRNPEYQSSAAGIGSVPFGPPRPPNSPPPVPGQKKPEIIYAGIKLFDEATGDDFTVGAVSPDEQDPIRAATSAAEEQAAQSLQKLVMGMRRATLAAVIATAHRHPDRSVDEVSLSDFDSPPTATSGSVVLAKSAWVPPSCARKEDGSTQAFEIVLRTASRRSTPAGAQVASMETEAQSLASSSKSLLGAGASGVR
jgi:hypothetical protein